MGVNSDGRLPLHIRRFRHGSPGASKWHLPTFDFRSRVPNFFGPVIAKPLNSPADEAA